MECSDGGVSWARNLATYLETRKWRRGLWELNAAASIAPMIAMLFGCYVVEGRVSGLVTTADGLSQALEVLGFGMCIAAAAFSLNLWLSSAADELCQSLDRFSTVIVERLLNSGGRSVTANGLAGSSSATTTPFAPRRTRSLANSSPFTLLNLND